MKNIKDITEDDLLDLVDDSWIETEYLLIGVTINNSTRQYHIFRNPSTEYDVGSDDDPMVESYNPGVIIQVLETLSKYNEQLIWNKVDLAIEIGLKFKQSEKKHQVTKTSFKLYHEFQRIMNTLPEEKRKHVNQEIRSKGASKN